MEKAEKSYKRLPPFTREEGVETIKEVAILIASILGSIYLTYQIKEKKIEIEIKKLQLQQLKEDGGK